MEAKRFLFIFRHPPHSRLSSKEGMDFALSCAAFEQKVDVCFCEDGVFQLLKNQDTKPLKIKNHSLGIEAFELYGIENIFTDINHFKERGLTSDDIVESLQGKVSYKRPSIKQYDYILNY